jgi:hypothetical protein
MPLEVEDAILAKPPGLLYRNYPRLVEGITQGADNDRPVAVNADKLLPLVRLPA